MDITSLITAILSMVEGLLPAITSAGTASTIDTIINSLTNMLPFIVNEITSLYTPVKNIIAALSANPTTTAQQLSDLQALDASVDAAFDKAAASIDAGS